MRAYSLLLIRTCHRRGVHAMGGMAAQIPVKNDPRANDAALAKVCISLFSIRVPAGCTGSAPRALVSLYCRKLRQVSGLQTG